MTDSVGGGGRGLKILLSHRYFWPDTPPYASMLRTLAEGLAAAGHQVTVFTAQPSYRTSQAVRQPREERLGEVRVLRIPMLAERGRSVAVRLLNNAWYVSSLFAHVLAGGSYDVIVAASFPPVMAGRMASMAARLTRTPFVYHCQDLHPEVSRISGMLGDGVLFRLLRALDRRTCRSAARVVVLSDDMKATLAARPGLDVSHVRIVNNFLPASFAAETARPQGQGCPERVTVANEARAFHIVFAGNLGRFQGLEAVLDAAHLLASEEEILFTFVGGGVAEAELRSRAGALLDRTVRFIPHQPQDKAQEIVRAADAALVTLRKDVYRVAYPSKTLTCLAMGTPLLAAVEPESELARMVEQEEVGWVAPPEDPGGLAAVVRGAFEGRAGLTGMRNRAEALYARRFAAERAVEAWVALMDEAARRPASV